MSVIVKTLGGQTQFGTGNQSGTQPGDRRSDRRGVAPSAQA